MSRASPLPAQPHRYVGDGFDYRRPVMSTSRRQQAAQIPTPAADVIDLTNDSDTSYRATTQHGTSVERKTPRPSSATGRQYDPATQRRRLARLSPDTQTPRCPVINLDVLDFDSVAAPPDPDEPLMVDNDEFLALFQETPSSPGFEITGEVFA